MADTTPLSSALLRPWLATLRTIRAGPIRDDDLEDAPPSTPPFPPVPTRLWIKWTFPAHAPSPETARAFEAIELFVLLAWADPEVWKACVSELRADWDHAFASAWADETLLVHPVVQGHAIECTQHHDTPVLYEYLREPEDVHMDMISRQYRGVRAILERSIKQPVAVPVRLRLKPNGIFRSSLSDALPAIVGLGQLQQALKNDKGMDQPDCRMAMLRSRIAEVHDDMRWFGRTNNAMLDQMMQVWATGIRVVDIARLDCNRAGQFVNALHALLGIGQKGCVRRVLLTVPLPAELKDTLVSALACSSSVREVRVTFNEGAEHDSERLCMQWVAYGLFRSTAKNNLKKISMHCQALTATRLEMMREILNADDPLVVMFPILADGIVVHQDVLLSTSEVRLIPPLRQDGTLTSANHVVFKDLRVLDHHDEWWTVYLPGWGHAWVHDAHAQVTRRESVKTEMAQDLIRDIHEMDISGSSRGNEATMVELVQMIGTGIKKLRLRDDHSGQVSRNVLLACPKLEALELNQMDSGEVAMLRDWYATGIRPNLKAVRLSIQYVSEAAVRELIEVLQVLEDQEHPMSKALESLEVYGSISLNHGNPFLSDVYDVALHMLQVNKTLRRFGLDLPVIVSDQRRLVDGFAGHDNLQMRISLTDREKAAFLSVVSRNAVSASQQFDGRVISSIFLLASELRFRQVNVTIRND